MLPALAAVACTPSFASQSQVTDLRILGIQAAPPEALFDATCTNPSDLSTCSLTNVDDVQITLLYSDPLHPNQQGVVTPVLCPTSSTDPICGPGSLTLLQQRGPQTSFSFFLGAALTQNQLQQLPALLIASIESSSLKGYGGVQVELQMGVDTGDANGIQLALKTLIFNPRTAGGNPNRNHNPLVTGMKLFTDQGVEMGTLLPGQLLNLPIGVDVGLRPVLAPGSVETYQTVDLNGKPVSVTETLKWDFYSTSGADFDDGTAYEPLPGVADPPSGLTRISSTQARGGTMWAVVHDGRGGTGWIELPWQGAH